MAGLVLIMWRNTQYTFDVKLWVIHQDKQVPSLQLSKRQSIISFPVHTNQNDSVVDIRHPANTYPASTQPYHRWLNPMAVGLGAAYVVGSIVGSVSYLQVSKVALANDLLWATFNMTGANTFLGAWLHSQLLQGVDNTTLQLNTDCVNFDGSFDTNNGLLLATNVGGLVQYDSQLNQIQHTIAGLRATDGCLAPWIFTQYCLLFSTSVGSWPIRPPANAAAKT
ncbi:Aste57867_11451 [Aphanomyces stellatus]|uniref:Aste57867_11451 protein n=1 Tax=Aphanomyces stellatus TaxID=120398 RepID=A0A485KT09_9STRA|nr:hypothetical protein As57867_011408 [Aphanomyces stellatus]VFT88312.1 Aste57867_11451 [Aphanomyces stellatus]